jgi:excisionase family DNA binding protein
MPDTQTAADLRARDATKLLGMTVREAARYLRVSPDKIRGYIRASRLGAINTAGARCVKPRFVILPHQLAEFIQQNSAAPPPKPAKRRKRMDFIDYFPD